MVAGSALVWMLVISIAAHFHMNRFAVVNVAAEEGGTMRQQFAGAGMHGGDTAECGALPDLGFDYPPLQHIRKQLQATMCYGYTPAAIAAAYASALLAIDRRHAAAGAAGPQAAQQQQQHMAPAAAAEGPLAGFLTEALAAVGAEAPPMRCASDATLLAAAGLPGLEAAAAGGHPVGATAPLGGASLLLASNLHNNGALMPHFILQALRLALLLPPGRLAVSLYESGSHDLTRQWAALLRMLLLPLHVPHNITLDGALRPQPGLDRISLLAALRNALVDPFLPAPAPGNATPGPSAAVAHGQGAAAAPPAFVPDRIAIANDIYFCAEDVLRLAMHRAHIACGFDFFTAPWAAGRGGGAAAADAVDQEADVLLLEGQSGAAGEGGSSGNSGADAHRRARLRRRREGRRRADARRLAEAGGEAPKFTASLRFYDKWVARDATGAKLSNQPPFVSHAHSAAALAAGRPVAAYCCWDGLAVLDAAPLRAGLRFRVHLPGECAASECSLLCDDFHRIGFPRVVLDPGVRVGYDAAQVAQLEAASGATRGAGAADAPMAAAGALVLDVRPALAALGPRRTWAEVADASAALGRVGGGGLALDGGRVECCDLRSGRSYVRFTTDCRWVDVMATNYTAQALAAAGGSSEQRHAAARDGAGAASNPGL